MTEKLSVIVRVNPNRLADRERWSIDARDSLVSKTLASLRKRFTDITFGNPNPTACTVSALGKGDSIAQLVEFLDQNPDLGKSLVDAPFIGFAEENESVNLQ